MSLHRVLNALALTGSLILVSACADLGVGEYYDEVGREGLPSQYPLMPGDTALWVTLDEVQRSRALSFLATGSTIQSSLIGDQ